MNDDRIQEIKERVQADIDTPMERSVEYRRKELLNDSWPFEFADLAANARTDITFLLSELSLADELLQSAIKGQETLQRAMVEKNARIKELEGGV